MGLSSLQLDAFHALAQTGSFTRAAARLHISQPAFSQRILNLEQELGTAVFVREKKGVRLTAAGGALLRYCQTREALEAEFLGQLNPDLPGKHTGTLRVAGFSSVNRSVILPALAGILREHEVTLHLLTRELTELPRLLRSGEADFVILDRAIDAPNVRSVPLGNEEYVLVEGRAYRGDPIYLDHDEDDLTTHRYLQAARKPTSGRRQYLDDIYGLLDAVREGLGRAVLPRHLTRSERGLRILNQSVVLQSPVVLNFHEQPFYSNLHKAIVSTLEERCGRILAGRAG